MDIKNCEAIYQNGSVKIFWTITREKDVVKYVIERSTDGKNYAPISEIPAIGETSIELEYFDMDNAPPGGKAFYRIVGIDADGNTYVSHTMPVECLQNNRLLRAYPACNEYEGNVKKKKIILVLRNEQGMEYYGVFYTDEQPDLLQYNDSFSIPQGQYIITGASDQQMYAAILSVSL